MTNNLLILGSPYPYSDSSFRGIDRRCPTIPHQLDENNPLHQAFLWRANRPDLTVQELAEARNLSRLLAEQNPPEHYELIELTEKNSQPSVGNELLGFDLAIDLNHSLLSFGLEYNLRQEGLDSAHQALIPLLQLVTRFFRPQLNTHGLFDEYAPAEFCLDCLLSLQKLVPNIFDSWEGNYRVVGVWRIPDS